jgi:hypothetical protein
MLFTNLLSTLATLATVAAGQAPYPGLAGPNHLPWNPKLPAACNATCADAYQLTDSCYLWSALPLDCGGLCPKYDTLSACYDCLKAHPDEVEHYFTINGIPDYTWHVGSALEDVDGWCNTPCGATVKGFLPLIAEKCSLEAGEESCRSLCSGDARKQLDDTVACFKTDNGAWTESRRKVDRSRVEFAVDRVSALCGIKLDCQDECKDVLLEFYNLCKDGDFEKCWTRCGVRMSRKWVDTQKSESQRRTCRDCLYSPDKWVDENSENAFGEAASDMETFCAGSKPDPKNLPRVPLIAGMTDSTATGANWTGITFNESDWFVSPGGTSAVRPRHVTSADIRRRRERTPVGFLPHAPPSGQPSPLLS